SPLLADVPWVYGELGLEGEVLAPEDVFRAETEMGSEILLTGTSDNAFPFNTVQLKSLKDLSQIEVVSAQSVNQLQQASAFEERYFCQKSAKLMAIIATGEHSALMVGPAGSGKTTLCESIPPLLKSPSIKEKKEIRRWALAMNWPLEDRPFVMPHHSTPNISMIGGGIPPMPGEITRAHKGVLVLDELLEFSNPVKESLREPIVSGQISVSRRGVKKEYPADFLLLATSNLCPCGQLVPKTYNSCRFSLTKCRSYTEKLSGPLADRFHILAYSHLWEKKEEVALSQIKEQVQQAQAFAKQARQQELVNSKLSTAQILATCDHFLSHGGMPEFTGSRRRFKAVLQVARTLADLQQCEKISLKQVQTAMSYAQLPFMELQQIFA
ncbi:MAG: ATP-binding protein, partial [Bdellovibrionales bacterium]|nr:ATP-binding protein [Bdellovibrionales bacterium]